jgi:hypothetical protein
LALRTGTTAHSISILTTAAELQLSSDNRPLGKINWELRGRWISEEEEVIDQKMRVRRLWLWHWGALYLRGELANIGQGI